MSPDLISRCKAGIGDGNREASWRLGYDLHAESRSQLFGKTYALERSTGYARNGLSQAFA